MRGISRRSFIASSTAVLAAGCSPKALPPRSGAGAAAQARNIHDRVFEEMLRLEPENATNLGLDVGVRASLKGRLKDLSTMSRPPTSGARVPAYSILISRMSVAVLASA